MLNRFKQYLRTEKDGGGHDFLRSITVGSRIVFAHSMPLQSLAGSETKVVAVRNYHFGGDATTTYTLRGKGSAIYHLTLAEDAQGVYLGISRELPRSEWSDWFDPDALDFFISPSSARTLKLLADAKAPVAWSAPRYQKMIDGLNGELRETDPVTHATRTQRITYTLLASESGDKAIEIERLHERDMVRLYATLYRPESDIEAVLEPQSAESEPLYLEQPVMADGFDPEPQLQKISDALKAASESLEKDIPAFIPKQGARPDFRRIPPAEKEVAMVIPEPLPLPSFLLEPQPVMVVSEEYTLENVMAPETTQVRCDVATARVLMEQAAKRNLTVRDTLRAMLGLSVDLREEVIFEVPLSDEDYKELAMRYQLKASHREEIQARMLKEIRNRMQREKALP